MDERLNMSVEEFLDHLVKKGYTDEFDEMVVEAMFVISGFPEAVCLGGMFFKDGSRSPPIAVLDLAAQMLGEIRKRKVARR